MEDTKQGVEKLPAEVRANMLSNETSVYFNVALFEQVQRVAIIFAKSTMVPNHFRGNIGNCMIALNYAYRLRADEFMVFQNLYEVHGTPGITGKLVTAVINQSNKYSEPLEYEWLDPADNPVSRQEVLKADIPSDYGCQAFTTDRKSNKKVTGPKITWALIKSRGWYDRKGADKTIESNNWRTMPEQMFYYRASSWFGNKHCPELTLGMYTVEELQDITELGKMPNGTYAIESAADTLKGKGNTQESGENIYKTQDASEKPKEKEVEEPPLKEQTEKASDEPPATKDAHDSGPKEVEDPLSEFKGLKPRAFKKLLDGHKNKITTIPPEHQDVIKALWDGHFPGQPFPIVLASDPPPPEDKPKASEKSEEEAQDLSDEEKEAKVLALVKDSESNGMKGVLVPCPNRDAKIKYTICDVCMYKERVGCPTWIEFDKAG